MQVAVERPVGDERVVVVRRADDDRIDVLLLKAFAPVGVGFGTGKELEDSGEERLVVLEIWEEVMCVVLLVFCLWYSV
jgi:hypothetical protein